MKLPSQSPDSCYLLQPEKSHSVLQILSSDGTNRLQLDRVFALIGIVEKLAANPLPLIITGNERFFSAGADLNEIAQLSTADSLEFAHAGQRLMSAIDHFPALVCAALRGYCMGGGLDLALACDLRIADPNAAFGHRGAALGLITGWGGTQRLSRLVGKSRALQLFATATRLDAHHALEIGLISEIAKDPLERSLQVIEKIVV